MEGCNVCSMNRANQVFNLGPWIEQNPIVVPAVILGGLFVLFMAPALVKGKKTKLF